MVARFISRNDLSEYAWKELSTLSNAELVASSIAKIHNLPSDQMENARKQAGQIVYLLKQAFELRDAAKSASPYTRALQLYYCVMNLAICEILLRKSGDASFDRSREVYKSHGLTMSVQSLKTSSLDEMLGNFSAKSVKSAANVRFGGTFTAWASDATGSPIPGNTIRCIRPKSRG